jgi:hypothetical protein
VRAALMIMAAGFRFIDKPPIRTIFILVNAPR